VNGDPNWFEGYFEHEWLDEIAVHISDERTQKEVDFVVEKLELEPPARILDLASGHGRHSIELARRGFDVTGFDLSPRSLELALAAAEKAGVELELVQGDMRELPYVEEFDAVVNLFTAFGYFDHEDENQHVLVHVERALVPGGRFLIDTINLLGLARRFNAKTWEEREGGAVMLALHEFDFVKGRNNATWTFLHPDGKRTELRHSLRTYAPHELVSMLTSAGLEPVGTWGDFEGAELGFETWRLIVRADKPK
jgi:SAM-dependent methyltransferase